MSEKNQANGTTGHKGDHKGDADAGKARGKEIVALDQTERADGPADREPAEGLRAFALDHPLALIGGGVVAGLLIGSLLPRGTPGRLSRSAAVLAGLAGEWGVEYARKALSTVEDVAHEASETGAKVAGTVGEKAGDFAHGARDTLGTYSGKAADTAEHAFMSLRNSAEGLARQVIRLTSQLRH